MTDRSRTSLSVLAFVSCAIVMTTVTACHSSQSKAPPVSSVQIDPPSTSEKKAKDMAGIHNVVCYASGLISGGVPEGHEGLETLHAMGVKTIVSVDGATPDVEGARKLGMQYVHLPISY